MIRGDNLFGGNVVIKMNHLSGSLKLGDMIVIYPVLYGWIYLRYLLVGVGGVYVAGCVPTWLITVCAV